jgi:hypothetical protein
LALFAACDTGGPKQGYEKLPTELGSAYSLSGVALVGTSAVPDVSSLDAKVYADSGAILQVGTITHGSLDLSLPAMDAARLSSVASITDGRIFTPSGGKWFFLFRLYVVPATSATADYELRAVRQASAMAKFIYVDTACTVKGSRPDGATMTDSYDCDLRVGWNWVEWGWPSDALRTCSSVKSASYEWGLYQIN